MRTYFTLLLLLASTVVLAQPTVSLTGTDITCFGDSNGTITLTATNGTPPMSYTVNGGSLVALPTGPDVYEWLSTAGGIGEDGGFGMDVDAAGNTVIAGYFNDTVIIGSDTLVSNGSEDVLVAMFDPNGNPMWARGGGGTFSDQANSVSFAPNGDIYVTGFFAGNATFGTANLSSAASSFDVFLLQYDGLGNWIQGISIGGIDTDNGRFVKVSDQGTVYLALEYQGTLSYGPFTFVSQGDEDIAYMELDNFLAPSWAETAGGPGVDRVYEFDFTGPDMVMTGLFEDSLFIGTDTLVSAGLDDFYLARLDTNGVFQWSTRGGGAGTDAGRGVEVDGIGNIFVSGYTTGGMFDTIMLTTNVSSTDILVNKYDPNGNIMWGNTYGGPDADFGFGISVDAQSNYYATGLFLGSATFGTETLLSSGNQEIFVLKGTTAGDFTFAIGAGGSGFDTGNRIVTNLAGESYFTGSFESTALFDTNSAVSAGGGDLFVAKLIPVDSASDTLINLGPGLYVFDVIDQNDTTTDSILIVEPPQLILSTVVTDATGSGGTDGAIDLTVTGGTPGYTFLWNTADTTEDLSNLSTGLYDVTVTDSNGCTDTISAFVDTITPFIATIIPMEMTCTSFANGSLDVTVSGGTPPYTYVWSNGPTTQMQSNVSFGVYSVTVTDALSATTVATDTVDYNPIYPDPTPGTITGPLSVQPFANYLYSLPATNGSSYTWNAIGGNVNSTSSNNAQIGWGGGPVGTIIVIETNQFGCQDSSSTIVQIDFVSVPELNAFEDLKLFPNPASENIFLSGSLQDASNVRVAILSMDGRLLKQVNWSLGSGAFQQTLSLEGLASGAYLVRIADEHETAVRPILIR